MANVVQPHPQIEFLSSSLGHPPLGLSLSMPSSLVGWSPSSVLSPSSTANQLPLRTLKRRFEQDEENADQLPGHSPGARDIAMERSPTPERPKRGTPKRARNGLTFVQEHKEGKTTKESHNPSTANQDVDVGVLLG